MTTPEALNELADRVEREEPGYELDKEIKRSLRRVDGSRISGMPRHYTTSLDAAVTLVPGGDDTFWRLGHDGTGPDPSVFKAEILVCSMNIPGSVAWAATPAAALTAAALRARAADMQARAVGAPHPSRTA